MTNITEAVANLKDICDNPRAMYDFAEEDDWARFTAAVLADIRAVLAAVDELRDRAAMADDFLAFMSAELAQLKCCHEDGGHHNTPPMMWPELIGCIAARAVKDALAAVEAGPQWRERPTCDGLWLTCGEYCCYRTHRVQERDLAEWKFGECYGPIPRAANDRFRHVSAAEAFAALREASAGRWDNVDPEAFVNELRRDDLTGPQWQPITTAPRDGTQVLLLEPFKRYLGGYAAKHGKWVSDCDCELEVYPIAWMPIPEFSHQNQPLPAPPERKDGE